MLIFLPAILLALTVFALIASNLQRGFRSNWLLALGGAALAWLSLLYLRLQLPLTASVPIWSTGEGVGYSANFILDDRSWTLAFVICALLIAALLGQVRDAMSAPWLSWAPGLAVGGALILALLAGESLTFAFVLTLLDVLAFTLMFVHLPSAEERRTALRVLPFHFLATALLLAAWVLSFYGDQLTAVLISLAASLRVGLWTPKNVLSSGLTLRSDLATMLRLAPLAASLAMLTRIEAPLQTTAAWVLLTFVLLSSLYLAATWFVRAVNENSTFGWTIGQAGLAVAAASVGHEQAALAFALLALIGPSLANLVQRINNNKLKLPFGIASIVLLAGFPFTASHWTSGLYASFSLPIVFAFLPVQALLHAGWLRYSQRAASDEAPPEPWMQRLQLIGTAALPVVFVVLGFGLLPAFSVDPVNFPIWPPLVVGGLALLIFFAFRRRFLHMAQHAQAGLANFFSLRWLTQIAEQFLQGIAWLLRFASRLLEGHAGIFWAILFTVFLLSLVAQISLAG